MKRCFVALSLQLAIVALHVPAFGFRNWSAAANTDLPGISAEQKKIAALYVAGMWDMRERLRSGEFKAVETKLRPSFEGRGTGFTKIVGRITGAFDAEADAIRFDRTIEYTPHHPELSHAYRYASNKNYSCFFRGDEPVLTKREPDYQFSNPDLEWWDVRLLGLKNWGEHQTHLTFTKMRAFYGSLGEPTEVSEQDGVCQITWTYGDGMRFRRRVTIDRKQGFAVTRMDNIVPIPKNSTNWELHASVEVAWKEQSGAWVPQRVDFLHPRLATISPREKDDKHFIDLEWLSINRPVKDSVFIYEGFKLPAGTRVWDKRVNPAILEKVIGD